MCALCVIAIGIGALRISNTEILRYGDLEKSDCSTFMIPDEDAIDDPDSLFKVLTAVAEETGSNIIRTSLLDGKRSGTYELRKYVLIANADSQYMQNFRIKSGRLLTAEETEDRSSDSFLSTELTKDKKQVGELNAFLLGASVTVYPMGAMFDYVKADGLYYAELGSGVTEEEFLESLRNNIRRFCGVDVSTDDLKGSSSKIGTPYTDLMLYDIVFFLMLLLFVLLTFYYLLRKRRDTAVMKLMGVRECSVWRYFFAKPLIICLIFIAVCFACIAAWKRDAGFALDMTRYALLLYPGIAIFFVIAYGLSNIGLSFADALKGQNFTRGIYVLHVIAEIICILMVLYCGASAYIDTKNILRDMNKYKSWTIAEDYGVFYPLYSGDDQTDEEEQQREKTIGTDFYHYLNEQDAIFINATDYEDAYMKENKVSASYQRLLTVNPNYLKTFAVYEENGKRVSVDESDTDLVLLVPETEKDQKDEILSYYQQNQESCAEVDQDYYEADTSGLQNQNIQIIWTKSGQKIFTFDDSVNTDNGDLTDPVITVLTENNSYISQRIGILGNGNSDPLKVKLTGTSKQTYDSMKSTLSELGLADNLKAIVSVNEAAQEKLTSIRSDLAFDLRAAFVLLALIIYLAYQSTYLLFEKNKKRYVVMHMFGLRWTTIYGKPCLLILGLAAVIAAAYGGLIRTGGVVYTVFAVCLITFIHLLVMFLCVNGQMKKKTSDVLKGI
jgi:putative ABC transport system permease protein